MMMSPCNSVQPPSHLTCAPVASRLRSGFGACYRNLDIFGVHGQSSNPNTMWRLTASGSVRVHVGNPSLSVKFSPPSTVPPTGPSTIAHTNPSNLSLCAANTGHSRPNIAPPRTELLGTLHSATMNGPAPSGHRQGQGHRYTACLLRWLSKHSSQKRLYSPSMMPSYQYRQ